MKKKNFVVTITAKGSQKALPAIWYGGLAHRQFEVIKSIQYPSCFEVIKGKYKGMIIDPKDCERLPETETPYSEKQNP